MASTPTPDIAHISLLGSWVFHKTFAELAAALRWMFWGLLLQLIGGAGAIVCLGLMARGALPALLLAILPPVLLLVGTGSMVLVWGEHRCLHLKLPLGMTHLMPGRNWLRAAYWCAIGAIVLRFSRHWMGPGPLRLIIIPMEIASLVLLLLFLRRIATVIDRSDLRRFIDAIFALGMAAAGTVAAMVAVTKLQIKVGPVIGLGLAAVALLVLVALPICYAVLLWRMGTAARGFAEFLEQDEGEEVPHQTSAEASLPQAAAD